MDEIFTTFATSRFVNSEKVIQNLRECARRLIEERMEVVSVHLFGSFGAGSATPKSDADVIVETERKTADLSDISRRIFENAAVPVELCLLTTEELSGSGGIAAAARREGIVLAQR